MEFEGSIMSSPTQEVLDKVKESAKDGKISCTVARKLGTDMGVPLSMVGSACDELKIKIFGCELGCFK
jgi:hypothetical protein